MLNSEINQIDIQLSENDEHCYSSKGTKISIHKTSSYFHISIEHEYNNVIQMDLTPEAYATLIKGFNAILPVNL